MRVKVAFWLSIVFLISVVSIVVWGLRSQPSVRIVGTPSDRRLFDVVSRTKEPMTLTYWIDYYQNGDNRGSVLTGSIALSPRKYGLTSRHKLAIVWATHQENQSRWAVTFDGEPTKATGELMLSHADQGAGLSLGEPIVIRPGDAHTLAIYGYGPVRAELSGNSLEAIVDHMTHVCVLKVKLSWGR